MQSSGKEGGVTGFCRTCFTLAHAVAMKPPKTSLRHWAPWLHYLYHRLLRLWVESEEKGLLLESRLSWWAWLLLGEKWVSHALTLAGPGSTPPTCGQRRGGPLGCGSRGPNVPPPSRSSSDAHAGAPSGVRGRVSAEPAGARGGAPSPDQQQDGPDRARAGR